MDFGLSAASSFLRSLASGAEISCPTLITVEGILTTSSETLTAPPLIRLRAAVVLARPSWERTCAWRGASISAIQRRITGFGREGRCGIGGARCTAPAQSEHVSPYNANKARMSWVETAPSPVMSHVQSAVQPNWERITRMSVAPCTPSPSTSPGQEGLGQA